MGLYTIIRIYQIPADSKQQATDRMAEALALGVEQDFHVTDIIQEKGAKQGTVSSPLPEAKPRQAPKGKGSQTAKPASWMSLIKQQLTGK